jgi:hypothetical protein
LFFPPNTPAFAEATAGRPPYRGVTSIYFSPYLVSPFEKGGLRGISLKGWWVGKDIKIRWGGDY